MSVSPLRKPDADTRPAQVTPRPAALPERTESTPETAPARVTAVFTVLADGYAALSARSLLHVAPPSVPVMWENHRQAAACCQGSLWGWLRLMWGAGHCTAAGTLYLLIAVAFSPAGFVLLLAALAGCWLWL